jgi:hypothetical protein
LIWGNYISASQSGSGFTKLIGNRPFLCGWFSISPSWNIEIHGYAWMNDFSFGCVICRTTTEWAIRQFFILTGRGKPLVPLCQSALFQAWAGIRVEPPKFCKLAWKLPHIKESKVPVRIRTHCGLKSTALTTWPWMPLWMNTWIN